MMMEFRFVLTPREVARQMRANGVSQWPQWRQFLFVAVCLFPSIGIFYLLESGWSLLWFSAMAVVLAINGAWAYVKNRGVGPGYSRKMRLTDESLVIDFSHSTTELKWAVIDRFEETGREFFLYRYSRCWLIPKRVLGQQAGDCRRMLEEKIAQAPGSGPVALYRKLFFEDDPQHVYGFQYQSDELQQAARSRFRPVDPELEDSGVIKKSGVSGRWVIFVLLVAVSILGVLSIRFGERELWRIGVLTLSWTLPVVFLGLVLLVARWRLRYRDWKISEEPFKMAISEKGWSAGSEQASTWMDWRDIEGFFISEAYIGFKTIEQLVHLIPRRIFSEEQQARQFLLEAREYKQNCGVGRKSAGGKLSSGRVDSAQETGNPYQPPTT